MTTAKEWGERVRRWRASGETAEEFCARHGWKAKSLQWWSWQVNRSKGQGAAKQVRLVPVVSTQEPRRDPEGSGAIVLELRGGHRVRLEEGFDERILRRVFAAMEGR